MAATTTTTAAAPPMVRARFDGADGDALAAAALATGFCTFALPGAGSDGGAAAGAGGGSGAGSAAFSLMTGVA
jgi:hypothetical protein